MSRHLNHFHKAHRALSAADALAREIIPSSGDRETDVEIEAARQLAVMRLRERAECIESGTAAC